MKIDQQWDLLTKARKSPPVDVLSLPPMIGVRLQQACLGSDISGMLEGAPDGTFTITVNASDPQTRQRFTIAHELGHYMLHRHLVGAGIDDDRAYRSTSVGRYHNTAIGPKQETEANKFAASLLMPKDIVDARRAEAGATVSSLAAVFGVSEHAMSIRLGLPYEPK